MDKTDIVNLIVSNCIHNEDYFRKVNIHIKPEYFPKVNNFGKEVFLSIKKYFSNYDSLPTRESLLIEIKNNEKFSKKFVDEIFSYVESITYTESNLQWIIDKTEEWCKERAIYNALVTSVEITERGNKEIPSSKIPSILQNALAVSFNSNIGHNYEGDLENRLGYYQRQDKKIAFDLSKFNEITKGGLSSKTLNVIVAGTGVGKSMFLCHYAMSSFRAGHNVLYITCEMSEESIAERIDSNFLDIPINDLRMIDQQSTIKAFNKKMETVSGRLIIKEYPTSTASSVDFENLLNELNMKKQFVPDLILIDYVNICTSSRFSSGSGANSYAYIKAIAEELRSLACKHDVPVLTATQVNRTGFSKGDLDLADVSESFGLPATADFMFALISGDDLEQKKRILVKQLKNRYNDITKSKHFFLDVDRTKMRISDSDEFIHNDYKEEEVRDKLEKAYNPANRFSLD